MTSPPDIYWTWNGHAMAPLTRFSRFAEKTFTSGVTYRMIVEEERSRASHNQYFAAVHEAFMNLREPWDVAFPNEVSLRKYCLIKAGFCTVTKIVGSRRVPIDGYAIVVNEDGITTVYQAKSQSVKAMGPAEFAKSKRAVLDILADMIGTTADQLMKERAA